MKKRRFALITAAGFLALMFIMTIMMVQIYIEESYASMAAHGYTGTPAVIGIFVFAAVIWAAAALMFLVIDLIHACIAHGDESIIRCFFLDLGIFLLCMLLYVPLLFLAMYIGAMNVKV